MTENLTDGREFLVSYERAKIPEPLVHLVFMKSLAGFKISGLNTRVRSQEPSHVFHGLRKDISKLPFILLKVLRRLVYGQAELKRELNQAGWDYDFSLIFGKRKHLIRIKLKQEKFFRQDSLRGFAEYLKAQSQKEGYLVIFDLDRLRPLEVKFFWESKKYEAFTIHLVGY
ncbi:MAG: hypothetical protein LBE80_11020 [Deltaproteobacteria bacterium]|nr:hypothetical protein [Deltaproteobacteria bacterium]